MSASLPNVATQDRYAEAAEQFREAAARLETDVAVLKAEQAKGDPPAEVEAGP